MIGTVGTEEKAKLAKEAEADEAIVYTKQDFVEEVDRITEGEGCHVVYDSVGKDTFDGSPDCLQLRGYLVLFGDSSGPVPPVDLQVMNQKGGLYVARPLLAQYAATREELPWRAEDDPGAQIGGTYKLSNTAQAHEDLEGRKTADKLILIS